MVGMRSKKARKALSINALRAFDCLYYISYAMDAYQNLTREGEVREVLQLLVFWFFQIIPTRCRDLHLKQFCLEDIAPAVLIILITHIILAVRWMLIKILSAVINGQRSHKVIVPGGCYLDVNIIRKIDRKIKISAESFR